MSGDAGAHVFITPEVVMSEKIYVVMGNTGEYSDFREWIVDAWRSEERAQARVIELEHLMRVHQVSAYSYDDAGRKRIEAMREDPNGDPGFGVDYTGTTYHVGECELKP